MTRKTLLVVVGLLAVVGLTLGLATNALAVAGAAHTITAIANDGHGTINPIGSTLVPDGGSLVYTMEPAAGYQVASIGIDTTTAPKAGWYTFLNVTKDHTITVTFKANPAGWYTISPHAGPHGQIWMAQQTVQSSETTPAAVACSIMPDRGYRVATLLVDGVAVAPATHYTFYNVAADHTISATFTLAPPTITIASNAYRVGFPKPFSLSGVVTPCAAGQLVRAEVRKPGSIRWSYSSARVTFGATAGGGSNWWYRYLPRIRGTYAFRARYGASLSRTISVAVK